MWLVIRTNIDSRIQTQTCRHSQLSTFVPMVMDGVAACAYPAIAPAGIEKHKTADL